MTPGRRRPVSAPVGALEPAPGLTDILFVCRANQCRSPYAAELARRIADPARFRISSAGLLHGGHAMPPVGRSVAGEFGLDFSAHVSRELDIAQADGFDVILTMTKDQIRELIADHPELWPRVFTVKAFARWCVEHPLPDGVAVRDWIEERAQARRRTELLGSDPEDEVADPLTEPAPAWRAMVHELQAAMLRIFANLGGPGEGQSDSSTPRN